MLLDGLLGEERLLKMWVWSVRIIRAPVVKHLFPSLSKLDVVPERFDCLLDCGDVTPLLVGKRTKGDRGQFCTHEEAIKWSFRKVREQVSEEDDVFEVMTHRGKRLLQFRRLTSILPALRVFYFPLLL